MADEVERNRASQTEVYGEPLLTLIGRCGSVLGLTQARIAALLGISAPMLSQLMNGRRAKLGNPAASQRLQLMRRLLIDVESQRISVADAVARLERYQHADMFSIVAQESAAVDTRAELQEVFRATAPASDFRSAADLVAERYPEIAELLRRYGGS